MGSTAATQTIAHRVKDGAGSRASTALEIKLYQHTAHLNSQFLLRIAPEAARVLYDTPFFEIIASAYLKKPSIFSPIFKLMPTGISIASPAVLILPRASSF